MGNEEKFAELLRKLPPEAFISLLEILAHREELKLPLDLTSPAVDQPEGGERQQ